MATVLRLVYTANYVDLSYKLQDVWPLVDHFVSAIFSQSALEKYSWNTFDV